VSCTQTRLFFGLAVVTGDQPALSAQTRTHEMYTQKLFAAILQLLAHERSLITKRMLVKLTEKRFKKTQGEKWAMWQSED